MDVEEIIEEDEVEEYKDIKQINNFKKLDRETQIRVINIFESLLGDYRSEIKLYKKIVYR